MNYNLLLNKIYLIQDEYKNLLLNLLPKIEKNLNSVLLYEIKLFWFKYIKEIDLYLRNHCTDGYLFTASSAMNLSDNEHLPFLLINGNHIYNDPLTQCQNIPHNIDSSSFFYKKIILTIKDNINIIKNTDKRIIILPLSMINNLDYSEINKIRENLFINFFNGISSINDFFIKCKSINDIIKHGKNDISDLILFTENDNPNIPFIKRFEMAFNTSKNIIGKNISEPHFFFASIYGMISQSLDAILSCRIYNCYPYIRSKLIIYYILLFSENFDFNNLDKFKFITFISYLIHALCNKNKIKHITWNNFLNLTEKNDLMGNILTSLNTIEITNDNFMSHKSDIARIISEELDKLFEAMLAT